MPSRTWAQTRYFTTFHRAPIGPALERFARSSGINISYDGALTANAETKGLNGAYSIEKGFETLLSGTGILALKLSGGWVLKPIPGTSSPAKEPGKANRTGETSSSSGKVKLPTMVVSTIQEKDLMPLEQAHRNLASDISDLFDNTPSVVVSGGGRNAQRIYLRGIESTNLNMTIDGARQERPLFQHHGSVGGLDPDMLKQVEIQTLGNADSGPGALGGSISFETLDAQDLLLPGKFTGARLKIGYSSVDDTTRGSAQAYALLKDHIGILVHVSGADRENYENGNGRDVLNTAGEDRDYLFKISMLDWAAHSLRLSAQKNTGSGHANWGGLGIRPATCLWH